MLANRNLKSYLKDEEVVTSDKFTLLSAMVRSFFVKY